MAGLTLGSTFPAWVFDNLPIPDTLGHGENAVKFRRLLCQLARRMDAMHFAPLSPVLHAPDVLGLIDGYASRANLGFDLELTEIQLAERRIHAAAFQFGPVIEIIIAAIEVALLQEAQTLQARHFSLAYEHRTSCSDAFTLSSSAIIIGSMPASRTHLPAGYHRVSLIFDAGLLAGVFMPRAEKNYVAGMARIMLNP